MFDNVIVTTAKGSYDSTFKSFMCDFERVPKNGEDIVFKLNGKGNSGDDWWFIKNIYFVNYYNAHLSKLILPSNGDDDELIDTIVDNVSIQYVRHIKIKEILNETCC